MPRKRSKTEQIMALLRQVEVLVANGLLTPQAGREAGISEQTYYRWRKEDGGLKLDQAERLKALEQENAKFKRLVAELSLEQQILKDAFPPVKNRSGSLSGAVRTCHLSSGLCSNVGEAPSAFASRPIRFRVFVALTVRW